MEEPCYMHEHACAAVVQQTVDVALPLSLVPSINFGDITSLCCGEPRVECCAASGCAGGLELKITQTLTYKIPIAYGVAATAGNVTAECKKCSPNTPWPQCRY